ncbi:hypothetical protein IWQ62_003977 [Dispira parvispora]|uniref:IMD domain-containing protein n=1 Tax=Dispira parvispora TaxID=1520584 RepID=A0A9W8ASS7_9FUNG|nr:hypothetical protein IWQ62_003977 [Dispira parvispora]
MDHTMPPPTFSQQSSPPTSSPLSSSSRRPSSLWGKLAPWSHHPTTRTKPTEGNSEPLASGSFGYAPLAAATATPITATSRQRNASQFSAALPIPRQSTSSSCRAPSVDMPGGQGQPFIIVDRKEYGTALSTYQQVLTAAENYRMQSAKLGQAAVDFGQALEQLARSHGTSDAATGLQSASGVHYILANQYALLSTMLHAQLEVPLQQALDNFTQAAQESEQAHDVKVSELSAVIQSTEENYVLRAHQGGRELGQFRQALQQLTTQLDHLEQLKQDYATDTQARENGMASTILRLTSTGLRALVDICDRISQKVLSDPQLEPAVAECPDPFQVYETEDTSQQLFSVLQPLSMGNLSHSLRDSSALQELLATSMSLSTGAGFSHRRNSELSPTRSGLQQPAVKNSVDIPRYIHPESSSSLTGSATSPSPFVEISSKAGTSQSDNDIIDDGQQVGGIAWTYPTTNDQTTDPNSVSRIAFPIRPVLLSPALPLNENYIPSDAEESPSLASPSPSLPRISSVPEDSPFSISSSSQNPVSS